MDRQGIPRRYTCVTVIFLNLFKILKMKNVKQQKYYLHSKLLT
jgi:hypothetical protein